MGNKGYECCVSSTERFREIVEKTEVKYFNGITIGEPKLKSKKDNDGNLCVVDLPNF